MTKKAKEKEEKEEKEVQDALEILAKAPARRNPAGTGIL